MASRCQLRSSEGKGLGLAPSGSHGACDRRGGGPRGLLWRDGIYSAHVKRRLFLLSRRGCGLERTNVGQQSQRQFTVTVPGGLDGPTPFPHPIWISGQ